ncbi:MAG: hypothetical protein KDA41_01435, partial [Planctomycetales bacterium]|nr:hypothetical protein [Planctomycetales bacterium]
MHKHQLRIAWGPVLALAAFVAVQHAASAPGADRYWLLMRSGASRTGQTLDSLDRAPLAHRPVTLDGKPLFNPGDRPRMLRDVTLQFEEIAAPHIEMRNGDRLIGSVMNVLVGKAAAPWPDHLVVENTTLSGTVRVR